MKKVICVIFFLSLCVITAFFSLRNSKENSKTTIRIATYSIDDLLQDLIKNYDTNSNYNIELVDYSEVDLVEATKRLKKDVFEKKIDIIYNSSFPYDYLKESGVFANIPEILPGGYNYLEQNYIIEKDAREKKLYQISIGFRIISLASSENEKIEKWNNIFDYMSTNKSRILGIEKEYFALQVFFSNFNFFINWSGEKHFLNQDVFLMIIEFLEQNDRVYDGSISYIQLPDFIELQTLGYYFDRPYCLMGFPTVETNSATLNFMPGFSISAYTEKTDACQKFIEYCLSDKVQEYMMQKHFWFPTSMKVIYKLIENDTKAAYIIDEYGNQIEEPCGYSYNNGLELALYSAPKTDVDVIMNTINNAENYMYYDYSIKEIISKAINEFYEEKSDADEMLNEIENGVTSYIVALNKT